MSRKSRDQRGQFKTMVRYDGRGRIIPGGNILKKGKKPQEGNWEAKEAYECCATTGSFKMTITSTSKNPPRFEIPLFNNERYDFTIDWGDGTSESILIENTTGDPIIDHIYSPSEQYQISISGTFPGFTYLEDGDPTLIDSIDSWGDIAWSSMEGMFNGAVNMVYNATDVPDLSNVTNTSDMFNNVSQFNANLSAWDISNVTDMGGMFRNTSFNNGSIKDWDVSNVTNMSGLFSNTPFNQDISSWDVSNVTEMGSMFLQTPFNQDISSWNVSSVSSTSRMFKENTSFNQDLSSWDVSGATVMFQMFQDATSYNQDLSSWDVSGVTSCSDFSLGATSWVQPQPTFTSCTP
jgi:surface protein